MVEPIDAQNMLARTPLVEKTAATQRENALQLNQAVSQLEKEKLHQHENVQFKREAGRTEDRESHSQHQDKAPDKKTPGQAQEPSVELVTEEVETPEHRLDVTI